MIGFVIGCFLCTIFGKILFSGKEDDVKEYGVNRSNPPKNKPKMK